MSLAGHSPDSRLSQTLFDVVIYCKATNIVTQLVGFKLDRERAGLRHESARVQVCQDYGVAILPTGRANSGDELTPAEVSLQLWPEVPHTAPPAAESGVPRKSDGDVRIGFDESRENIRIQFYDNARSEDWQILLTPDQADVVADALKKNAAAIRQEPT
jgi:hypothetical protein